MQSCATVCKRRLHGRAGSIPDQECRKVVSTFRRPRSWRCGRPRSDIKAGRFGRAWSGPKRLTASRRLRMEWLAGLRQADPSGRILVNGGAESGNPRC